MAIGLLTLLAVPFLNARAQGTDPSLVGTYSVGIVLDDIPKSVKFGPMAIGQWEISFHSDGAYTMTRADVGQMVTGIYEVKGNEVTITDQSGLLSCADAAAANEPNGDVSSGTYEWKLQGDHLSMEVKEDGCVTRTLILGTRDLTFFVSCQTPAGSVAATASPEASPVASDGSDLSDLAVKAEDATPAASPASSTTEVEKAIDDLLDQLTACWATGDPTRFLRLLTDEYAQSLLNAGQSEDDLIRNLATAMASPITYQRAGDVTIVDDTHATAIVRTSNGDQEQFIRFKFALVDGEWKLDGPA